MMRHEVIVSKCLSESEFGYDVSFCVDGEIVPEETAENLVGFGKDMLREIAVLYKWTDGEVLYVECEEGDIFVSKTTVREVIDME